MNQSVVDRAADTIAVKGCYCAMALTDLDGFPTVSTITPSKSEGIKWVTFCTGLDSNKSQRVRRDDRAALCFNSHEYNITLVGRIEVVTDPAVKHEMWYDGIAEHFSSPDDPHYCVLRFITERYNILFLNEYAEDSGSI